MLIYFCYFIDVNHMRMSDGTNKAITYLTYLWSDDEFN